MALTDKLTAIGNAIREKTGGTALIPLADMPEAIANIPTGSDLPQWSDESSTILYSAGLSNSDYTGTSFLSANGTYTAESYRLTTKSKVNVVWYGGIRYKLDLTNISKVKMLIGFNSASSQLNVGYAIWLSAAATTVYDNSIAGAKNIALTSATPTWRELDVSSLSGEYYVQFAHATGSWGNQRTGYIYSIMIERS